LRQIIAAAVSAPAVILSTRFLKIPIPHDAAAYRERNQTERCFNKLKHFRRRATRYDRRPSATSPSSTSPPSCFGSAERGFALAEAASSAWG
jgi:transposase